MSSFVAGLPMYDWPERRAEVDAQWEGIRVRLGRAGIAAPVELTRSTGDLYDFWRQPDLLLAQTCWGPMEDGLAEKVIVVGQQNYDGIRGGKGESYSSAIVVRREAGMTGPAPVDQGLPLDRMMGARLAYNVPDSMSGYIALERDLVATGADLSIFSKRVQTGGHRKSIRAVAEGAADVAAIDCLSWRLALKHEPAVKHLVVVGWTAPRKGLPFITSAQTDQATVSALREILVSQADR